MKSVYFFKENNCHNQLTFDFYIKFSIFQAPKVKNDNNFNRIGFYLTVLNRKIIVLFLQENDNNATGKIN